MVLLREIKPEDGRLLDEFLSSLSPRTIRFFTYYPLPKDYGEKFSKRQDIVCYVADLNGKIVGYAWWEPTYASQPTLAICVQDDYQGNGIGKRLLGRLINEAKLRGKKGLQLTVSKDNVIAISLYLRFGFKIVSEFEDSRGTNYLMELSF